MIRSIRSLTQATTGPIARSLHTSRPCSSRRIPGIQRPSTSFDLAAEQTYASTTVVDDKPEYPAGHLYPSTGTFVASSTVPSAATGRPVPINVLLNEYAPLRHKGEGDKDARTLVCELQARAFEHEDLDFFVDFAQRAAFFLKMPVSGSIPLPTRRERWTVIRSPFVHAKSKENFERRTHKRLLKVYDANPEVVEVWLAALRKHAMPGVGLKAHLYTFEEVKDVVEKVGQAAPQTTADTEASRHFGNAANRDVANAVLDLLSDPVFKPLLDQTNADTSEGAPEHAIKPE